MKFFKNMEDKEKVAILLISSFLFLSILFYPFPLKKELLNILPDQVISALVALVILIIIIIGIGLYKLFKIKKKKKNE